MRGWGLLYRLGAMTMVFSGGVFFDEPYRDYLARDHSQFNSLLLLYGFPVLVGFSLLVLSAEVLKSGEGAIRRLCMGLALVSFCWLGLWVLVWRMTPGPLPWPMHLLALGAVAAAILMGFRQDRIEGKQAWFLTVIGGSVGYMGAVNLLLQPATRHFIAPALGGLLVIAGVWGFLRKA
ncbi:MAG TPA: hypothetical protein VHE12_03035 [bacterium]|nr:hypothetical protein [bacterium]